MSNDVKSNVSLEDVQVKWDAAWKWVAAIALALSTLSAAALGINFLGAGEEEVAIQRANVPCYFEQGGATFVAGSGCTIDVQSGGTLDLDSGSTFLSDGGLDLNGSTLTWDADADTTSVSSTDDVISTTLGAAAGTFEIITGNLKVGNGTPDTSLDGEDAYVEGTLEVDGAANFDGAIDIDGDLTSATGAVTVADTLDVSGASNFQANVDVGTFLGITPQTAISVTAAGIITPTGSFQPLTSGAAVTTSTTTPIAITGFVDGDLIIFRNDNASAVITIDGTGGTVECKADVALGARDTVSLIFNGAEWNCLSNYDNS